MSEHPRREPDGRGKRLIGIAGGLVGVFTGIGTVAGAIAYAVLWRAYASFYSAFGLTPEEVGLSQERLLVPAGFTALFLIGLLVVLSLSGVGGYWVMPARLIAPRLFGTFAVLVVPLAVGAVLLAPLFASQAEPGVAAELRLATTSMATVFFALGVVLAVLRWDTAQADESWPEFAYALVVVVASVGYGVLAFLLSRWLTGHGVPPTAQGVILGAPGVATLALLLTRWRSAWSEEPAEREVRAEPMPRRRLLPAIFVAASLATVLVVWGLAEVLAWTGSQRDAGARAIELGYPESSSWLDPVVRPIFVRQLDADSDPVGVCGDSPFYAASLIGQNADGWWVLLRPPEDADDPRARVVWLHRDTYAIDLTPMVVQPKKPGTGDQDDADSDERIPWRGRGCA